MYSCIFACMCSCILRVCVSAAVDLVMFSASVLFLCSCNFCLLVSVCLYVFMFIYCTHVFVYILRVCVAVDLGEMKSGACRAISSECLTTFSFSTSQTDPETSFSL